MSYWAEKYRKLKQFRIESSRTRSILLYLTFVLISAVFWWFLTANDSLRETIEVPVEITHPESVRFITPPPDTIRVTINEKGRYFLRRMFQSVKPLKLRFDDGAKYASDGRFVVTQPQLTRLLRQLLDTPNFTSDVERIDVVYADQSKLVPVRFDVEGEAASGYVRSGFITANRDSVRVYASSAVLRQIHEVNTNHVRLTNLSDTVRRSVKIESKKAAIIEPNTIEVTIPIERLVQRKVYPPIEVRNAPDNVNVIFFPANAKVTYWSPKSRVNQGEPTVVVDYNDILRNAANGNNDKVQIQFGEVPGHCIRIQFDDNKDSVQYIIEKR
ncbi:MAG: YbbR-like domain-containing protein [Muribaculaceae bacterium]|nr:YbbR-like domain-containing protein [Muribaculaceae bacterium]